MSKRGILPISIGVCFLTMSAEARGPIAKGSFPKGSIASISAQLFDEATGRFDEQDLFSEGYAPINKLSTALLVVLTVDLGEECALALRPSQNARDPRQLVSPKLRPVFCERPSGSASVTIRTGSAPAEKQSVSLSKLAAGSDGKIRVPFLFFRRSPCDPLELRAQAPADRATATRRVDFHCGE